LNGYGAGGNRDHRGESFLKTAVTMSDRLPTMPSVATMPVAIEIVGYSLAFPSLFEFKR
jgi:hypothetical protein